MKTRCRLICRGSRGGKLYCVDTVAGKRASLHTANTDEARQLVEAKNNSHRQPMLNLQIARAYLTATDPAYFQGTWQTVMDKIQTHGKEPTRIRYVRDMRSRAFDGLRHKKLLETIAEDFLTVLKNKQMSVGHYLRRLHNLALNLGCLPVPVLAPMLWPKAQPKARRGLTLVEHQHILDAELKN